MCKAQLANARVDGFPRILGVGTGTQCEQYRSAHEDCEYVHFLHLHVSSLSYASFRCFHFFLLVFD
jgi:hypothetical protein